MGGFPRLRRPLRESPYSWAAGQVEDFLAFFRELAASPARPAIDDAFLRSKRDEILQERQRVAAERRTQREGGGQGAGPAG
jgi:hypothetical protein